MRTLVTGFPGFIARRLVRKMLADDADLQVTALVEEQASEQARRCADEIDGSRIELLVGDIAERRLALSDADWSRLTGEVRVVHHLAAIYNLAVPFEVAQRVNVDGTGNVLDFCRACSDFEGLHYVSTAYVAGTRQGAVYEHELALGQDFKNHYESTKFQAELWVRELMDDVPTTVYRPAIVVGDSRTGETQKFDGPYYLLRSISRSLRMHSPIAQFGRGEAPFNVVPVDYVVDAIAAIASQGDAAGETLHLVDPEPLTARELTEVLAREYAGREPRVRLPEAVVTSALRVRPVRDLFEGAPPEAIRYLNHPVRFDTRRAEEVLARHGLRCPRFPEYASAMVRFFREHEDEAEFKPGNTL